MKNQAYSAFGLIVLTQIILGAISYCYSSGLLLLPFRLFTFSEIIDFRSGTGANPNQQIDKLLKADVFQISGDTLTDNQNNRNDSLFNTAYYFSKVKLDSITTDTFSVNQIQDFLKEDGNYSLDLFFEALVKLQYERAGVVRILHYGDSQIEGDRITRYLRAYFQNQFGGVGLGYVPIVEQATSSDYVRWHSSNWIKYSVFQKRIGHNFYGLSGCVFRYTGKFKPETVDQLEAKSQLSSATFKLKLSNYIRYDHLKLMFRNPENSFNVSLIENDSVTFQHNIEAHDSFRVAELKIPENKSNIEIKFKSAVSPDVYGILLEGNSGVQIDNFALRGHSGHGKLRISDDFMTQQAKVLNPKLIIFHYGGNIVPYPNVVDFSWYEKDMYQMILKYKRQIPDACILVVGVADAARKTNNGVQSYPTVKKIRDAQKKAAERAGCAYWDLYEVMGGENSIVSWVHQNPPLAGADYAHFSHYGQRLVAKMLYSALIKRYNQYLKKIEHNSIKLEKIPSP